MRHRCDLDGYIATIAVTAKDSVSAEREHISIAARCQQLTDFHTSKLSTCHQRRELRLSKPVKHRRRDRCCV
jgi:hypothetical protein